MAFATALAVTYLLVPLAERIATVTGFYDRPGDGYKEHKRPTPYLGGLAVMAGFLISASLFGGGLSGLVVPTICAVVLLAIGTADDRTNLGIAPRLVVEIGVGIAVWVSGTGWDLTSSDPLDLAVTVAWVVGLINAFNLMDNLDGALATVAATSAIGIGSLALLGNDPTLAVICFSLAGSCAGFLPFNLARPSRMFLGDGGSMPIGFILAFAAMSIPQTPVGLPALAIGLLAVGVPVLDMAAVIVSRRWRGVGVLVGGRDHMTHRLFRYLDSERRVSGVLVVCQGCLCLIAVVLCRSSSSTVIVGFSAVALGAMAVGLAAIEPIGSGLQRVRQDNV